MDVDIVILDLNIPKIDRITILEKIKQKNMNTKVIVISGESDRVFFIFPPILNNVTKFIKLNYIYLVNHIMLINLSY